MRGWWSMACWNGLSELQQQRLIKHGNLSIDYRPEGGCERGAQVAIETEHDEAPGPRFYCLPCALTYLSQYARRQIDRQTKEAASGSDR